MPTTIKLKNGSGAPLATDLVQGEVALDLTNKRIYSENAAGAVVEMGTNPSALAIAGTNITATAAELNVLDGITATTAELNILDSVTATAAEINKLDGLLASTAQLNILNGATLSTAELNILDGVTATAAELNILDGVTSTTAELNILDGVTSTAAELNVLDGITATTTELNYTDGVTSAIQTQLDAKYESGDSPTFVDVIATELTVSRLNVGANLGWNGSTDAYTANTTPSKVTNIHEGMKRCVLKEDGSVNYYLNPSDSTEKIDGTAATLDGTDGYVMVEVPKFYFRYVLNGSTHNWQISDVPQAGFQLHPAFYKDGNIVDYRYIGAYDACMYDDSASAYVSGTNLTDMTSSTDTAADKLASVSGIYPIVGLTRDECRSIAENNGAGWRVVDFWLISAIQMLYVVEFGSFFSQNITGAGNTNGSYLASSSDQNDSPHTIAGASNSLGNASTNTTTGAGVSAKPGTSFMSYRGIENFYGNCWNWVDGVNIGVGANYNVHVSNVTTDFADNTATNYDLIGQCATASGYVQNIYAGDVPGAFIPNDTTGASSSTYLTDYFYINTGNRVALFGGDAAVGAFAGAFCWGWALVSSYADRTVGCRLSY